jgi:hypothetical protein
MTEYGPDGVDSLRSRRLTRATDLSCTPPMCSAASDVTFPPLTTGGTARMGIFPSRRFRVNSGGIYPACPDEGRERGREGSLRRPHVAPISNRELDLLERDLSHCKQRTVIVSNRELSTIPNSTISVAQPAQPTQRSPRPLLEWRSRPAVSDTNFRPLAPFLPGSAQYVECDVTHSKHTTATFLPGSRIARLRLAARQVQP